MAPEGPAGFDDQDPIKPQSIEHNVDEIIIEGQIEQKYNFIDYWFVDPDGRARARVYLDRPHEASIFPPLSRGVAPILGADWATRESMIRYLARRYLVVREVGLEGLRAVWMATHARHVYRLLGLPLDD
jgi:hypothetical protein